ncbi:MAG: hypothetical protein K2M02_11585 [Duncaniella sp.]|nr:hypothetical protein [Duncaniella sp.]MDE6326804.1 hypothetical protein [Duncaniella sp.]
MKKFYYLFIGLMAVAFGSCDENARLAREIQGTWTGTPERLNDAENVTSTIVETYTFTPDEVNPKAKNGNVTITGNVSSNIPVAVSPVSISAAATTSIQGTWTVIDDDEIALVLDPKSLQVKVDPEAVTVSNDIFTDQNIPQVDSLRREVTANIAAQLRRDTEIHYMSVRQLDDVKIKGPILKFEISDIEYVLTRQGEIK